MHNVALEILSVGTAALLWLGVIVASDSLQ
jgi:hypothetical protein